MPGIRNFKALAECYDAGRVHLQCSRKISPMLGNYGAWSDMAMWPGDPRPIYYLGNQAVATQLKFSTHGGLNSGPQVGSSVKKHLHTLTVYAPNTAATLSVTPGMPTCPLVLCDYLLYYPFLDETAVDEEQLMVNSAALPRYEDGEGVMVLPVVVAAHQGFPATITLRYTNSRGVPDRVSQSLVLGNWQGQATQFAQTMLLGSQYVASLPGCVAPYIQLQTGDTGVRSIEGVTVGNGGDVGLFTLVLVKPLVNITLCERYAPAEVDFFRERAALPRIYDDACLNFFGFGYTPSAFYSSFLHTVASFIWS